MDTINYIDCVCYLEGAREANINKIGQGLPWVGGGGGLLAKSLLLTPSNEWNNEDFVDSIRGILQE